MRVLLTGGGGMLGTSIAASWAATRPGDELVRIGRSDVDLTDRAATRARVAEVAPDAVIHAAAKVGGIGDKLAHPTGYLLDNLQIDSSVIGSAIEIGVPRLLYVSSGAVYPEDTPQPIPESALLTGPLENANEGYALSKIVAGKLCAYASAEFGHAYRVVAPSNMYGPHDAFTLGRAHLIAAAIAKTHAAKVTGSEAVSVWGDGTARREFTFAPDVSHWLTSNFDRIEQWPALLNLGAGVDYSIREYYEVAAAVVDFDGRLEYDTTKPSGVHQRLLDSSAARTFGWNPTTTLLDGMAATYASYLSSTPSEN